MKMDKNPIRPATLVLLMVFAFTAGCDGQKPLYGPIKLDSNAQFGTVETEHRIDAPLVHVPTVEPTPQVRREAVRELLEQWLTAQNESDFAAYRELYDDSFEGLISSGGASRFVEFNRPSWLDSRREYFERPMKISIDDVVIETFAESAEVLFVETRDVPATGVRESRVEGPKELFVVRDGDELRIGGEVMTEMRRSLVEREKVAPQPDDVALVWTAGDDDRRAHYLVLDTNPESDAISNDVEYKGFSAARAAVEQEEISRTVSAWQGRAVRLFDPDGEHCIGEVSGLFGLVRMEPHFGQFNRWTGSPRTRTPGEPPLEPLDNDTIAAEVWQMGSSPVLAAAVDIEADEECGVDDPVWGRSEKSETSPLREVEAQDSETAAVLDAFRGLEKYEEIQHRFLEQTTGEERQESEGTWSTLWGAEPKVSVFRSDERQRTFAFASASSGIGCGEFLGELSGFFELRTDDGEIRVVRLSDFASAFEPAALVDADHGGVPHIVGEKYRVGSSKILAGPVGTVHRVMQRLHVPSFECGC